MKSSDDDLKSVCLSNDRHGSESKTANNSNNTKFSLSEKDAEQHRGNFEETIGEEDKFNNLVRMSRNLAHQLNNLLTTILANTQLMLLMVKDKELGPYLGALEDAARDAGMTVREFQKSVKALAGLSSQEDETQRSNRK